MSKVIDLEISILVTEVNHVSVEVPDDFGCDDDSEVRALGKEVFAAGLCDDSQWESDGDAGADYSGAFVAGEAPEDPAVVRYDGENLELIECRHEPDWNTVSVDCNKVGADDIIDVSCKHCGCSGSFVAISAGEKLEINWD